MSSFTRSVVVEAGPKLWRVVFAFEYWVGVENGPDYVAVPEGRSTDLESIPRLLRSFVGQHPSSASGAVVHDEIYKTGYVMHITQDGNKVKKPVSRKKADDIFLEALKVSGASWKRRNTLYIGVRTGGWITWNKRHKR